MSRCVSVYPLNDQGRTALATQNWAGDMIGIALIVPLAMPALAMRGGLLMHTWLALAASEVFWLLYDVWVGTRG